MATKAEIVPPRKADTAGGFSGGKVLKVFELSQNTVKRLSGYENWTAFLRCAAWQYKYPFEDQLLIYAQRPDATACASIEVWNKNMHRWINKGAKGIALLREEGNRYRLNYVFDVADTRDYYNRDVQLWQYNNRYDSAVIETLANNFGDLAVDVTINDAIISAAHNAVQDNKADYLHELGFVKSDSFLRGLDNVNLDLRFRQTAEVSVAYMVMQRMGLQPDSLFDYTEFEHIRDFNTPETLSVLGDAVSAISEETLRSISETIRAEQRRERNSQSKFAQSDRTIYNRNERNINTVIEERNDENGRNIGIPSGGRLSDTELDSTTGGSDIGQVWNDASDIPQTAPQEPVLVTDDNGQADRAFDGDRQNSNGAGGANSVTDGESRGSDRTDENERAVEMDRTDEQLSSFGRRNSSDGAGVQLNIFDIDFPTEIEQQNIVRESERNNSDFFMPRIIPQQIIDEVLTTGSNDSDSVLKICVQYSKQKSDDIEFLKNEYGTGGKGFLHDGSKISSWWNNEGIRVAYGDRAVGRGELITWEQADKRISELLDMGRFAPQQTLDKIRDYEYSKAASAFWYMNQDVDFDDYPDLRELFQDEWFNGGYPDSTARIAELLRKPQSRDEFINATSTLAEMYVDIPRIMRFKMYSPDKVLSQLQDLQLEHKTFTANEMQPTAPGFITEDELDQLFIRHGSGFSRGHIRTYLYFQEHSDLKERMSFLKDEYRTGGYGGGIFNEWHDAKGISFSRADIFTPYSKVTIPWNRAVKRIDGLIKSGKYLTEKEIAEDVPKYQSEQEQQRIRNEKDSYLRNMSKLSPEELRQTLPKRIQYFTDVISNYERDFFEEFGVSDLLDKSEIYIGDVIKDNNIRSNLILCMDKVKGATSDAIIRNCATSFTKELSEMKTVTFYQLGDFYECFNEDAANVSREFELAVMKRTLRNGETVDMAGIPADPNVRNFSYTVVDGDIYFRENSIMNKVELNATAQSRIKGMIEIRDCMRI